MHAAPDQFPSDFHEVFSTAAIRKEHICVFGGKGTMQCQVRFDRVMKKRDVRLVCLDEACRDFGDIE